MPKVKDVAVIGVPSQHSGERPRAFVVLEKDTALTADEITEFCYTELAHYKVPKDIVFLDEIPKNTVGKIMKEQLKVE